MSNLSLAINLLILDKCSHFCMFVFGPPGILPSWSFSPFPHSLLTWVSPHELSDQYSSSVAFTCGLNPARPDQDKQLHPVGWFHFEFVSLSRRSALLFVGYTYLLATFLLLRIPHLFGIRWNRTPVWLGNLESPEGWFPTNWLDNFSEKINHVKTDATTVSGPWILMPGFPWDVL